MKKLYSINFWSIFGLLIIVWITLQLSLASFDKHMYSGVNVVGQTGNVLQVELDKLLSSGTDSACFEATHILKNIAIESGYDIQVIAPRNEWAIFNSRVMNAVELTNIIESGHPY